MSKKVKFWNVIWQVVEFILTLGLSHIVKRRKKTEESTEIEDIHDDISDVSE